MFKPSNFLLALLSFIFIAGIIVIYNFRAEISKKEQIIDNQNSFITNEEINGLFKCDYVLNHCYPFFSGEIQIIPSCDTIKSISVNGIHYLLFSIFKDVMIGEMVFT
jgi:hypothetical protein